MVAQPNPSDRWGGIIASCPIQLPISTMPSAHSSTIQSTSELSAKANAHTVVVLLATFNGVSFLDDQVDSIMEQESCAVDLWVSDDQSTDGTWERMCERSKSDRRISLLPRIERLGSAARNFFRLLIDVDCSACDYVALSDQDDIWFHDKLALGIAQLGALGAAGFSSNVVAMWPNGKKKLIRKSQAQRRFDFLFESAGPGCTYLLTADCVADLKLFLTANRVAMEAIQFHDWFVYAWARSRGLKWHIEPRPTLYYRQHANNEYGVNSGLVAFRKRLGQIRSGWYRQQILQIAQLVRSGASFSSECAQTVSLLERNTLVSRLTLAMKVHQLRRRLTDRALLALACLLGGI
jgi:rhamnosyltransferase